MNSLQTLIIVLGVLAFTGIILAVVMPYLKRRGVDLGAVLDRANNAVVTVSNTLDVLRPFFEDAPVVDAFDKIISAARIGVGNAEQLYLIGQLEPDQRKEAARKYIDDALKLMGVDVTPEVEKIIDGAIEAEVLNIWPKENLSPLLPTITAALTPEPPTLGRINQDVMKLQDILNVAGVDLKVDGIFGPLTEEAVKTFQTAKGLAVDGTVGPETWAALGV